MDLAVTLTVAAGAYALPALFVLRWMNSPSRRAWVRPALAFGLWLFLIWTVNLLTMTTSSAWSSSIWFAAMNVDYLGTVGVGWSLISLAHVLTARTGSSRTRVLWIAISVGFWLVGIYRSLLAPIESGASGFRFQEVFTMGTVLGLAAAIFFIVLWLRHRATLLPGLDRGLVVMQMIFLPLLVLVLANDALGLTQKWWGIGIPGSPAFLVASASLAYVVASRVWRAVQPEDTPLDYQGWCRQLGISDREQEVLDLVATGLDRVQIAERLFISPVTVKNHLAALYRKTRCADQTALAALASKKKGSSSPDPKTSVL